MKNKLLLLLFLGMFLISFASADLGKGIQGNNFTIPQVCSDATYVTLSSIQYPDRHIENINMNMTSLGNGAFAYNFTKTSQLGIYDVMGISDGCQGEFKDTFEIKTNLLSSLGFYIIFLIIAFGIIILGYSFEDAWVVILGAFVLILFGLFVIIYGINGMKDTSYTWGIGIVTIMLGAYFGIRGAIEKMDEGIDN